MKEAIMDTKAGEHQTYGISELPVLDVTPEAFAPFGTVIAPKEDGTPFSDADGKLDLSRGTPRFYAMRLPARGLTVKQITRHTRVTQTLASAGGHPWFIAVAPPSKLDDETAEPAIQDIKAFRIPGDYAIMLYKGTWHAGPHFEGKDQSFFNLELADTNVVDHQTCKLTERYGRALLLKA
jgi:ureidoglycolate lyase